MKQIKTRTLTIQTALRHRKAKARYLRAAILAHPDLVHKLRPATRRPTVRHPTRFGH